MRVEQPRRLQLLGRTFAENGHSECGKALLFEAENLFDS